MSQENVEVVRKPLRVSERTSRRSNSGSVFASPGWSRHRLP